MTFHPNLKFLSFALIEIACGTIARSYGCRFRCLSNLFVTMRDCAKLCGLRAFDRRMDKWMSNRSGTLVGDLMNEGLIVSVLQSRGHAFVNEHK